MAADVLYVCIAFNHARAAAVLFFLLLFHFFIFIFFLLPSGCLSSLPVAVVISALSLSDLSLSLSLWFNNPLSQNPHTSPRLFEETVHFHDQYGNLIIAGRARRVGRGEVTDVSFRRCHTSLHLTLRTSNCGSRASESSPF